MNLPPASRLACCNAKAWLKHEPTGAGEAVHQALLFAGRHQFYLKAWSRCMPSTILLVYGH